MVLISLKVFGPGPRDRSSRQVAPRADIDRFSPGYSRYFGMEDSSFDRDSPANSFGQTRDEGKRKCGGSSDCGFNCGLAQCYAEKGSRVRNSKNTLILESHTISNIVVGSSWYTGSSRKQGPARIPRNRRTAWAQRRQGRHWTSRTQRNKRRSRPYGNTRFSWYQRNSWSPWSFRTKG